MIKNSFFYTFWLCKGKWFGKRTKVKLKTYDFTDWRANNYISIGECFKLR